MQAELESRHDAEVATASAQAPQQLGVPVVARANERPVGRDDLCTNEVVAGQAVLSGQVADPPAEREAGDAGRADDAAGCDKPEGLSRRVEVEPRRAAVGIGDPPGTVDLDPTHKGQIDHQPAVTDAMSSRVVP